MYWVDWLIWLNHLSYSCQLLESVHMSLVTWLNWLIYSSFTDSRWLNQFIFTFCHGWIDWFGMSQIWVWHRVESWVDSESDAVHMRHVLIWMKKNGEALWVMSPEESTWVMSWFWVNSRKAAWAMSWIDSGLRDTAWVSKKVNEIE